MDFTAFLCEYNPFHAGHLAHLDFSREAHDATLALMSGCFVQRGEPAIADPWARAKAAVESGCDLVLLLPTFYALQPAEYFAKGAMKLLAKAGAAAITFGSPVTDEAALRELARLLEANPPELSAALASALDAGLPYPAAVERSVRQIRPEEAEAAHAILSSANATLGLFYLQALEAEGYAGQVRILRRPADSLSATALRQSLREGAPLPEGALPPAMTEALEGRKLVSPELLGPLFAYLCEKKAEFRLPDDGEGIEARLRRAAREDASWEGLLAAAKTRRYTRARLQRAVLHALLGIDADSCTRLRASLPLFVYPLAMNEKGQRLLSQIKAETDLPVVDRPAAFRPETEELAEIWALEQRAFDLYRLLSGGPAGQLFTKQALRAII